MVWKFREGFVSCPRRKIAEATGYNPGTVGLAKGGALQPSADPSGHHDVCLEWFA
jgi:hypothetical protein